MKKVVPLLCIFLFASACGSSGQQASNAIVIEGDQADKNESASEASGDDEALALEFASCMRDNGVEMDDPTVNADGSIDLFAGRGAGGGGDGQPDEDAREARRAGFESCGEIIEGASFFRARDRADDTERQDTTLQLAQCLRDNGYPDVEDPVFDDFNAGEDGDQEQQRGRRGGLFGDSIDLQDEEVRETLNECRTELGIEGQGRGGQGGGNRNAGQG